MAEITQTAEAREAEERLTMMENAFEYKQRWTAEIERCRRLGIKEPNPLPHPDDILINMRTGRVRTEGPLDEREKREWDKRLARRDDAQTEVTFNALGYKRARTDRMREIHLREWICEQYIDLLNDGLPDRYKTKLENRSWHPDASREGKSHQSFRKMRPSFAPKPIS